MKLTYIRGGNTAATTVCGRGGMSRQEKERLGYDSPNQKDDSESDSEVDDRDGSDVENRTMTKTASKEPQTTRSRTVTLCPLEDNLDGDSDAGSVQEGDGSSWDKEQAREVELTTVPPGFLVPESRSEAGSSITTASLYSQSYARRILQRNAVQVEKMVQNYVVHEVFKDMKFTFGNEECEIRMLLYAIKQGHIVVSDKRIAKRVVAEEFFGEIGKTMTALRTNATQAARKKYLRE